MYDPSVQTWKQIASDHFHQLSLKPSVIPEYHHNEGVTCRANLQMEQYC